jgi:preprotein translocase subunit YajC
MDFLSVITPAYAQAAGDAADPLRSFLVPMVLIFVVFWFLMIRPQQKKQKEHREMLSQLRRGDQIVTSGGIIGKVTKVISDTELQVEIADEVRVRVARGMVTEVLSRTEPAKGAGEKTDAGAPPAAGNTNQKPSMLATLFPNLFSKKPKS